MTSSTAFWKTGATAPRGIASLRIDEDAVPSIVRPGRANCLAWLAALSGVLSTAAIWCGGMKSGIFCFGPGVLFGLLVMLPWCWWCRLPWWKTLLIVVLSPLGYAAAVFVLIPFVSALVGSTILLAPVMYFGHRRICDTAFNAWVAGFFLGFLFIFPFTAYAGAILIWQVGVASFLANALSIDERCQPGSGPLQP
jgi:hypothetical protein